MSSKSDKTQTKALALDLSDASSIIIRADNAKLAELGYRSEFRREFSVKANAIEHPLLLIGSCFSSFTSVLRRSLLPFP